MNKFPQAKPVKPLYEIDGVIYRRIAHSEGINDPDAIRASVSIQSGPDKGGVKIGWFVKLTNSEAPEEV